MPTSYCCRRQNALGQPHKNRLTVLSELTNIRVEDVDLEACKIFIELGKGAKDRYILFPESFRLILKATKQAKVSAALKPPDW
jgi:hypothetical protein